MAQVNYTDQSFGHWAGPKATGIGSMKTEGGGLNVTIGGWSIVPESPLEERLLGDRVVQEGLFWGKPRAGHPEGAVGAHVADILRGINALGLEDTEARARLRVAAILHDAFKATVDRATNGNPKASTHNHGWHAADYAARNGLFNAAFCALLELHDKPRSIMLKAERRGMEWARAEFRALALRVEPLEFFRFVVLDSSTEGKDPAALAWFTKAWESRDES